VSFEKNLLVGIDPYLNCAIDAIIRGPRNYGNMRDQLRGFQYVSYQAVNVIYR